MRDMTQTEIIDFIKYFTWGTLIGVEGDKPYAVELSYGFDGDLHLLRINARRTHGALHSRQCQCGL